MKRLILIAALMVVGASVGAQIARADGVWVNGRVHGLATLPPPATVTHVVPLYVIAPVNAKRPLHPLADARTHGFGAHDHVAAAVFSGPCDLTLVVPGTHAKGNVEMRSTLTPGGTHPLVYAARIGGKMLPLTSVARIRAAKAARLVATVDTHAVISCKVSPG
ncbi:MAG: hypothetical protein ACRDNM_03230 [Gaiellaceae bacterium]